METEPDDLRSALEDAFDEAPETTGPATAEPAPADERAAKPEVVQDGPPGDRGDGRDATGKFAKRTPEGAEPALVEPPVEPPHDPYLRPPQAWKPGAREAWGSLPAPVREEVYRRERENARVVQESAQARQVHEYVGQLQSQYAPALQAEGVDVLTATANLMQIASDLRYGSPQVKAMRAAQIIRAYTVDVSALASVLDGMPVQQSQQQMMQDPRVDQLMAQLQTAQQNRQQQIATKATSEVESFGTDKEFFEDVREEMADLMEVAARRGVDMSLEQAYERACSVHPEIAKVMTARSQAAAAGNSKQSTQRARHAASSVRGTPAGASTSSATDLRSEIEAAIEQVGGR